MRPTDYLKSLALADWQSATKHRFTNALADGSLPPEKMLGYLRQDYLFLDGFVRLLASAIAQAPMLPDAIPTAQFLGQISGPENTYFLRSIVALGGQISPMAQPAAVTVDFQRVMRSAVQSGRYEQMLAVLVVAEWSYLEWASPYVQRAHDLPFWSGEWITLHSGDEFEAVVAYLRQQLDQLWPGLPQDLRAAVKAIFCQTVALEVPFFDAAQRGF